MDQWPFWMFEENIKIVNEIIEEEETHRKKEEEKQNQNVKIPDTNAMMKNASSITGNMPKF